MGCGYVSLYFVCVVCLNMVTRRDDAPVGHVPREAAPIALDLTSSVDGGAVEGNVTAQSLSHSPLKVVGFHIKVNIKVSKGLRVHPDLPAVSHLRAEVQSGSARLSVSEAEGGVAPALHRHNLGS